MITRHIQFYRSIVVVICFIITQTTHAAKPVTPPGAPLTAAECDALLQVSVTPGMDFGSYVGGTTGTIVMDVNGLMAYSGVVPAGAAAGTPATYNLTNPGKGCDRFTITITVIPANITMSDTGPTSTVTINNLVTSVAPTNQFTLKTTPIVTIGGTLNATATDAADTYTGSFDVVFSY